MSNREDIIAKVKKLRALSASTNLNEAANAARAAERLLQENDLSEAELEVNVEFREPMVEGADPIHVFDGKNVISWQASLLGTLSKAYNVSGFFTYVNGKSAYRAVGRASDLEILRYQFAFYSAELVRLRYALGKGQGKTWGNSFYLGAVSAIRAALAQAKDEVRSAAATSSALVVLDNRAKEALALRNQKYPSLKSRPSAATNFDASGYAAGVQAGSGLAPKNALTGKSVKGML